MSLIVSTAGISATDTVLEVGPGKGVLTEALLEKAARVIAVEKDNRLISFLKEKFSREIANGKLILVHADILSFDHALHGLQSGKYKVVANIPYYITGQLFKLFLESPVRPSHMVLLIQKKSRRASRKTKGESPFRQRESVRGPALCEERTCSIFFSGAAGGFRHCLGGTDRLSLSFRCGTKKVLLSREKVSRISESY